MSEIGFSLLGECGHAFGYISYMFWSTENQLLTFLLVISSKQSMENPPLILQSLR